MKDLLNPFDLEIRVIFGESRVFFKDLFDLITPQWPMASGTWFSETSRQSQAEPVKQQHTGISPNHVREAVPY